MTRIFILVALILCTSAEAQSIQTLMDQYDRAYASERYALALKSAEQIIENYPNSSWWHFQAGAALGQLGRAEEAIVYLERCAELGFSGVRSFEEHNGLDSLRELDAFTEVINRVRANAEVRLETFKAEALKHEPLVYAPTDTVGRPGLIIALHGTGMSGESMYAVLEESAEDAGMVLVCPDALRPSGGGFAWTYRDEAEWFVEHLIEWAAETHNADPKRVILIGFSQGANIGLVLGQTRTELFLGVVPVCGHYEAQVASSNSVPAPFYLMTGARDPQCHTNTDARRAFLEAGGRANLRVISGMGHDLPYGTKALREFRRALLWIERQAEED